MFGSAHCLWFLDAESFMSSNLQLSPAHPPHAHVSAAASSSPAPPPPPRREQTTFRTPNLCRSAALALVCRHVRPITNKLLESVLHLCLLT